jgi:hypothetical protein
LINFNSGGAGGAWLALAWRTLAGLLTGDSHRWGIRQQYDIQSALGDGEYWQKGQATNWKRQPCQKNHQLSFGAAAFSRLATAMP